MTSFVVTLQASAAGGTCDARDYSPILPQSRIYFEVRQKMISESAYFLAARRNFVPGNALEDWLAAELMINRACPIV